MLCKFKNVVLEGRTQGDNISGTEESSSEKMAFMLDSGKRVRVSQVNQGKRENIPSRGKVGPRERTKGKKEAGIFGELKNSLAAA